MKWLNGILGILLLASGPATIARSSTLSATEDNFGTLADGRDVRVVTLRNAKGVKVRVITLGAIVQSIVMPDRSGKVADIVPGYADVAGYVADTNHFGSTIGRYANRIAGGTFILDGKRYVLQRNDGPNALHGGLNGFDRALWKIVNITQGRTASVTLSHVSPDGDEGYPGELTVNATFTLNNDNALRIAYTATTTKPTIINLTGHSYFNLHGEGSARSILDHRLTIFADHFTPIDATSIPTGEIRAVAGTAFDFRTPATIGSRVRDGRERQLLIGRGYDHNYVLKTASDGVARLAARVEEPTSGRVLEILTDQPGIQLYTGNFLSGAAVGKAGKAYRQSDSLALEPQRFPDTPNRPSFGSARLDPGQIYKNTIIYRLSVAKRTN